MASPSKEGLRCGENRPLPKGQSYRNIMLELHAGAEINPCPGLLWEKDPQLGLGTRCYKDSKHFHPLEVSLRRAVEQNLLIPEQRERIRKALTENPDEEPQEKPESQPACPEHAEGEAEMTTQKTEEINDRRKIYLEINRLLLKMCDLRAEDIPELVELIVSRVGRNVQSFMPTGCGICMNGQLIPLYNGRVRVDPCTPRDRLHPALIRVCNHCSFVYEEIKHVVSQKLHE